MVNSDPPLDRIKTAQLTAEEINGYNLGKPKYSDQIISKKCYILEC